MGMNFTCECGVQLNRESEHHCSTRITKTAVPSIYPMYYTYTTTNGKEPSYIIPSRSPKIRVAWKRLTWERLTPQRRRG